MIRKTQPSKNIFISIEGCIGVGKTSLAKKLSKHFKSKVFLEIYKTNPFHLDYLKEPQKYAFHAQVTFMCLQEKEYSKAIALSAGKSIVTDFHFIKSKIFNDLTLKNPIELSLANDIHNYFFERTVLPDLLIYLTAELHILQKRIIDRAELYSTGIPIEFLKELTQAYADEINSYKGLNIIVDNSNFNYLEEDEKWLELIEIIMAKLAI